MKQSIAILLITIHLFNIIGYYGLFSQLEISNNLNVSAKLDDDRYAGSDAITLKLPFTLPYSSHLDSYERVEGKFTQDGVLYRLVKQKVYNDTLYVICVKDSRGTLIENALEELASGLTDNHHQGKSSSKIGSLLIKDYETPVEILFKHEKYLISNSLPSRNSFLESFNLVFTIDQPPRV